MECIVEQMSSMMDDIGWSIMIILACGLVAGIIFNEDEEENDE